MNQVYELVTPTLKGRQHLDEKYIPVKGRFYYDLNCIDHITKYVTAHLFVDKRTKKKCTLFLKEIKAKCYGQIKEKYNCHKINKKKEKTIFVSDKFWNYKHAFNKLFSRVAKLRFGVPIACKKYGLKHNNNFIERYNGKLEDRLKTMRGGFRSAEGAKAFMDLRRTFHNFIDPHETLCGKTPAEVAGINLDLGRNKLEGLIWFIAKSKMTFS